MNNSPEILWELGLVSGFPELVLAFITEYKIPIKGTIFGVSNGTSCVVIPEKSPIVYQLYKSSDIFNKIVLFCHRAGETCPHLVHCKSIIEKHNCIVFDRITPMNVKFPDMLKYGGDLAPLREFIRANLGKIHAQIGHAIEFLNSIGYYHGDVSIDNIGIDMSDNFVLFDYDSIKYERNPEYDMSKLETSLKFWLDEPKKGGKSKKTKKVNKKKKQSIKRKNRI